MKDEALTPREAAYRLGVRLDGVYSLLWAGKLTGRKVDGRWLISATDVEKRARERARGRAKEAVPDMTNSLSGRVPMPNRVHSKMLNADCNGHAAGEPGAVEEQKPAAAAQRRNKRQQILQMFVANVSVAMSSAILHSGFGSSFRTRVSELNRDPRCPVVIKNKFALNDGSEESVYWAEPKVRTQVPDKTP